MKITKRQLRRIIKEEKARILSEKSSESEERAILDQLNKVLKNVRDVAGTLKQEGRRDGVALKLELQGEALIRLRNLLDKYFDEFGSLSPIDTLDMYDRK